MTVATGAGGMAAAAAMFELGLSVGTSAAPEPAAIALLVIGAVALIARIVVDFESRSQRHVDRSRAQVQARRYQQQLLETAP
ncbi:PEP-CTERM sorting domain-containing protein [Kocuria sediminis]|nr:PEP-CTERM sorting domain-containing protein [Kocuria sediminis]